MAPRSFLPRDLLREVMIQQPAISPDGENVVYGRRTIERGEYRRRLWRVPYRGGRAGQLTTGDADGSPRFSPDGQTLLFLSGRSGSMQPWLLPLAGGEPTQLCELPGGVGAAEWSPDGRRVLLLGPSGVDRFLVGDPESPIARRIDVSFWRLDGAGVRDQATSAWVVGDGGGQPRRVTQPEHDIDSATWHPDGRRIAFLADPGDGVHPQAWSIDAEGGRPRSLVRVAGLVDNLAFAPGGTLALLAV